MKKLLGLFFLIITINSMAQNSWKWLNPYPNGDNFLSVSVAPNKEVYVVKDNSKVLYSSDEGVTWVEKSLPNTWGIYKYFCQTNLTHFALCLKGNLYKSTDGGVNWKTVQTGVYQTITDMWFVDSLTGFMNGSQILMTNDGGETWIHRTTPKLTNYCTPLLNATFDECGDNWPTSDYANTFSTCKYYINNSQRIIKASNSCSKEDTVYDNTPCYLSDLSFIDSVYGYAVGAGATILKTTDGGSSWVNVYSKGEHLDFKKTFFFNNSIGYILCTEGVYKTTDGGKTWKNSSNGIDSDWQKSAINSSNFNICFLDADIGVISDGSLLYRTTDGATSWSKVSSQNAFIKNIAFINGIGYFSGSNATNNAALFKSTDKGLTWVNSFTEKNMFRTLIYDMKVLGNSLLLLVSSYSPQSSIIYQTNDGVVVDVKDSISQVYFKSFQYINSETAFALDQMGSLYKTVDGGKTWNSISSLQKFYINDIYFTDEVTGYISNGGKIVKTKDAGMTWDNMHMTPNTYAHANSFYFLNKTNAFAVGSCGTIIQLDAAEIASIESATKKLGSSDLLVYPNPATKQITIELALPYPAYKADITVLNHLGQVVLTLADQSMSANKTIINTSEFAGGIYFIDIKVSEVTYRSKFIKQ